MSYATIATSAADQALAARVIAAAVQEAWTAARDGNDYADDVRTSSENGRRLVYPVCIAADVEAAYASALAAGTPNPGGDDTVVTDGMILANVQAKWPQDAP